ncbi:MAG: lipoprotein signal peptidase [Bacteroidaceae bacterium]|nr:lipoprotein signal peptidase [Bacteroidaceae bacterium]MBQ6939250.1 lipoprotein signal peptidase [Muribaculaceae bacterium]
MKRLSRGQWATIIVLVVLLIDQCVKFIVKTNMYIGESIDVTSWFKIAFIENNGAAFGMELGSKLFLSIFRVIASGVLGYALWYICRRPQYSMGFITCVALIEAGAIGNIIDCMFYGLIFNAPMPPEVATLFPAEGGYAPFFYGRVVDMLYFPLFSFYWPDWMPFVGGEYFEFFRPIFNIADSAICVGVAIILLFYYKQLSAEDTSSSDNTLNTEKK